MRTGRFAHSYLPALADLAPLDLLFVDGDHQEQPAIEYFEMAIPHLAPAAVVVFDDIRWSDGMTRAWAAVREHPASEMALDLGGMGLIRTRRS